MEEGVVRLQAARLLIDAEACGLRLIAGGGGLELDVTPLEGGLALEFGQAVRGAKALGPLFDVELTLGGAGGQVVGPS